MWSVSRSWKARKEILPWSFQKGLQPCQHFELSPVRLIPDFWPPELWDNKYMCVVIYYSSNKKLIHWHERLIYSLFWLIYIRLKLRCLSLLIPPLFLMKVHIACSRPVQSIKIFCIPVVHPFHKYFLRFPEIRRWIKMMVSLVFWNLHSEEKGGIEI